MYLLVGWLLCFNFVWITFDCGYFAGYWFLVLVSVVLALWIWFWCFVLRGFVRFCWFWFDLRSFVCFALRFRFEVSFAVAACVGLVL